MNRYAGRRFAAFLTTAMLLMAGLVLGPIESYAAFSTAVGLAFSVYVGGQSVTDWKKYHSEGESQ